MKNSYKVVTLTHYESKFIS